MKILVYGSLNYDYVYAVDHIVAPGETLSSTAFQLKLGGKGLNQAIAAARAGAEIFMGGSVGEDGALFFEACKESGVDTSHVKELDGKSGHAIIQLDKNKQNSILLYGGANRRQERARIDETLSAFSAGDFLILQNEINELPYLVDKAHEKGMTVVLNPSPFDNSLNAVDMQKVSFFLINEVEGEQLTGTNDPDTILEAAAKKFPDATVVLTLGDKGAMCFTKGEVLKQKSIPCNVADTTGAGDTFTGYLIASLAKGLPVKEGLEIAARAASIACSRLGAVDGIPYLNEVTAS